MSERTLDSIGHLEFDVLKEIGNIGAGNATTALSKMINEKVDMKVPKIELLNFKELPEIIGGAENIVVGILLTLEDDIEGMMMFVMERDSAKQLVKILMGGYATDGVDFSEMELSALQEIGNIISGAYLASLSTLTGFKITASIPYLSIDMAGAILSVPAIEFGKVSDKALLIESEFGEKGAEVNGFFIMIPTLESYSKIFEALGL